MTDRAALKAELVRLAAEIKRVQTLLHEADCDEAGVHVGDIVLRKGVEYRVTKVETWANPPWLYGVPKKKDGPWGIQKKCLYKEWSKP